MTEFTLLLFQSRTYGDMFAWMSSLFILTISQPIISIKRETMYFSIKSSNYRTCQVTQEHKKMKYQIVYIKNHSFYGRI